MFVSEVATFRNVGAQAPNDATMRKRATPFGVALILFTKYEYEKQVCGTVYLLHSLRTLRKTA